MFCTRVQITVLLVTVRTRMLVTPRKMQGVIGGLTSCV